MHLALELDQSQRVSADPKADIDLALTVLRKRIDEFGVAEPLVQQVGNDRIVVELRRHRDPERAKEIVQKSAFLEFRITDETGALEKALPVARPRAPRPRRDGGRRGAATPIGGRAAARRRFRQGRRATRTAKSTGGMLRTR